MESLEKYIIRNNTSIKEALIAINKNPDNNQTLFVQDKDEKIIGTLTDGDIRRGLINGYNLDSSISLVMHKDFSFLSEKEIDVYAIKQLKKKGICIIPILSDKGNLISVLDFNQYRSYLPIDAVLMAGGKGERLRPLTEKTPKPLIKVGDKAIIDYNIERLISYGIKHINVTINYLGEQLEQHFTTPMKGMQIVTVREPKYLGTMGSVQFVEEFYNDTILIMNSDLFTNIDYEDFYLHFKEHNADMSVASIPYNVNIPFGVFELEGRNIKGIKEKPTYHHYANAGIYLIKKKLLEFIPDDSFYNATDLIEELIRQQMKVIRFPITGYWIDIGQHSELKKAEELVKHMK